VHFTGLLVVKLFTAVLTSKHFRRYAFFFPALNQGNSTIMTQLHKQLSRSIRVADFPRRPIPAIVGIAKNAFNRLFGYYASHISSPSPQ
jgi:hypothetical protein